MTFDKMIEKLLTQQEIAFEVLRVVLTPEEAEQIVAKIKAADALIHFHTKYARYVDKAHMIVAGELEEAYEWAGRK